LKQTLFFVLGFLPSVAHAVLPSNCRVDSNDVLWCDASNATTRGNLVNSDPVSLDLAGLSRVDLRWYDGAGNNIVNYYTLSLSTAPGGAIYVGGYIDNNGADWAGASLALDAKLIWIGVGPSDPWNDILDPSFKDPNSGLFALRNVSTTGTPYSVNLTATDEIKIVGNVLNNTADGAPSAPAGAGGIYMNAGKIDISGDYISFGGKTRLETPAFGTTVGDILIGGKLWLVGADADIGAKKELKIGSVDIDGGTANLSGHGGVTIAGGLTNTGALTLTSASGITVAGMMANADAGTMDIAAGAGLVAGGISVTGGTVRINGGNTMRLGMDGLKVSGEMVMGGAVGPDGGLEINVAVPYNIASAGDVAAKSLTVTAGTLKIWGDQAEIDVSFGENITNDGTISVGVAGAANLVASFSSADVANAGTINIWTIGDLTTGAVTNWSGLLFKTESGDMTIKDNFTNLGAATLSSGGGLGIWGQVRNNNNSTLTLKSADAMTLGATTNAADGKFTIDSHGAVTIAGNLTNDAGGEMTLYCPDANCRGLESLTVTGNLSNDGKFFAEVVGKTTITGALYTAFDYVGRI